MTKNKISQKKLFMMLSTELFAMTSLILPAILVGFAGKNGLPVLLAASALLLFQAVWFLVLSKGKGESPDQLIEAESSKAIKGIYKTIYSVRFFIHGLFLIVIFVNLIQEVLLPGWNLFWILLPVLVLTYMTAGKQLRVRGRILEVLFPYIFVPLLLVLILALFQLDYASLPEQLWGEWSRNWILGENISYDGYVKVNGAGGSGSSTAITTLQAVYGVLLFYQPIEFLLFLLPALDDSVNSTRRSRTVGAACIFVIIINIIMYVAAIGMFGTVRTGEKLWSALYIMQSVRLPGNFVERLDILFLVFWIFSSFALFSAYLYYGSRFMLSGENRGHKSYGFLSSQQYALIWLTLIMIVALFIQQPEKMFTFFIPYKMWVDFPLSILLPAFLYMKKDRKRVKKGVTVALIGIMCTLFMTGCQDKVDIEDKNYVMTIGLEAGEEKRFKITYEMADLSQANQDGSSRKGKIVSYEADSLAKAEEMDKKRDDKKLDYGHLKVILFSKQLMENSVTRMAIMDELEEKTSIAGTTIVFFTEEKVDTMIETGGQQSTSFGEYMEKMMTNQKSEVENEDTLAKFLRDEAEKVAEREIFLLKIEGEQVVLEKDTLKRIQLQPNMITSLNANGMLPIAKEVLRFHIRANSDNDSDQEVKNAIKDRILPNLQTLLACCTSKEECIATISESLELIDTWVREACAMENYPCETKVYLCRESFPLKTYGNILLPSGIYDALRIDLGKAEGANWWCMMYPSLCFTDGVIEGVKEEGQEELEEKLETEDQDAKDALYFERNGNRYYVKWKLLEFLQRLTGW